MYSIMFWMRLAVIGDLGDLKKEYFFVQIQSKLKKTSIFIKKHKNYKQRDLLFHRQIEELKKLSQRGLVHDVYHGHFDDEEIEDGTSSGYRTEFFAGHINLLTRLGCSLQFLTHVDRRRFGYVQHIYQVFIIDKRTLYFSDF